MNIQNPPTNCIVYPLDSIADNVPVIADCDQLDPCSCDYCDTDRCEWAFRMSGWVCWPDRRGVLSGRNGYRLGHLVGIEQAGLLSSVLDMIMRS